MARHILRWLVAAAIVIIAWRVGAAAGLLIGTMLDPPPLPDEEQFSIAMLTVPLGAMTASVVGIVAAVRLLQSTWLKER